MKEWRTIVKYPNYEVSRDGQVRNKTTKRLKVFTDNGHGYLRTNFFKDNKVITVYLHRIIADSFIDNPSNLPEVNHIDGDKTNNSLDNLEWCTSSGNALHKMYVLSRGNCKPVECVETKVVYPSTMIAEQRTGCNHRHISNCCRGKRITCGGYHWRYA